MPSGEWILDTSPTKRVYYSIIADYGLNLAICELVDNVVDSWTRRGRPGKARVTIDIDLDQQTIKIADNAGGVPRNELQYIVGPGHTGNDPADPSIGIFGVGTKRAVVALAEDTQIRTRFEEKPTYKIRLDQAWLELQSWDLPYEVAGDIDPNSTVIELSRLRKPITTEELAGLKAHLGATYARFIDSSKLGIQFQGETIESIHFEAWAFPPEYRPRRYRGTIDAGVDGQVRVDMTGGLTQESSPGTGEYGLYVYCNGRLVGRALKGADVGFTKGLVGMPHPDISLTRLIVLLDGPAKLMPWNSSKSGINTQSGIFQLLQGWTIPILKSFASVSRGLSKVDGSWRENVFKFDHGSPEERPLGNSPQVARLHLPPIPKSKPRLAERLAKLNEPVTTAKPWTRGLFEGVAAARLIASGRYEQGNRIALIVLDSTLEIGFKEFLVNRGGGGYSDTRLQAIFSNRRLVDDEIHKVAKFPRKELAQIRFYYNLRCDLIHRKASISISDNQIADYADIVEKALRRLFGLKFSE